MTTTTITAEIEAAREVDTRIASAWSAYWSAQDKVLATEKSIRLYASMGYVNKIAALTEKVEAQREIVSELRNAALEIEENEYKGWSRFFLVQHIHRDQYCSSFRPTTRVGWLPEVSGLTEDEAVAEYGATLCTKCFATAPVAK